MAKIIFSDGSEIRGRVGGKIYSRNASGAYIRTYTKPVNPSTLLQNVVRNIFSIVSNHFRLLSVNELASWEAMRPFYTTTDSVGNVVTPTASQLHGRLNGKLLQNGIVNTGSLLTICPTPITLDSIVGSAPEFDLTAGDLFVNTTFGVSNFEVPGNCVLVISATAPISNGISSVPANSFKRIKTFQGADNTSTVSILGEYNGIYSTPTVGQSVHFKVELISQLTGQASSTVSAKALIV